jgi:hypothetical protein
MLRCDFQRRNASARVQAAPQSLKGFGFAQCLSPGGPQVSDLAWKDRQGGRYAQHDVSEPGVLEVVQTEVDDVDLGISGERAAGQVAGGL